MNKDNYHEQGNIIIMLLLLPLGHISNSLLQRRRGAWEVVQERMQIVVCIDEDGTCAEFVVRGWQIWFPPSAF